jgi:hypothetical protein
VSARQERNGRKFGEQGRAAVAVLQEEGITGYSFAKGKHAEVTFNVDGQEQSCRFACTPRSPGNAARTVRRKLSAIIDQARGRAASDVPEKEKSGPVITPNRPERQTTMLQTSIAEPVINGKAENATHSAPLFAGVNAQKTRRHKVWLKDRIETARRRGELIAEVVDISPALAEIIINEHNAGNRPLKQRKIDIYRKAIEQGRWKLHGQSISFSKEGLLNNGQNRLSAIVAAGRAAPALVVFGEDRDVFDILDTNAIRTASDTLHIAGHKYTVSLAGAARFVLLIEAGTPRRHNSYFTNDVICEAVADHTGLAEQSVAGHRVASALRCSAAAPTAAFYLIATKSASPERLEEFIAKLVGGDDLPRGSPILLLRERIRNGDYKYRAFAMEMTVAIVKAWNAFAKGKKIVRPSTLAWPAHDDSFPDVV